MWFCEGVDRVVEENDVEVDVGGVGMDEVVGGDGEWVGVGGEVG